MQKFRLKILYQYREKS